MLQNIIDNDIAIVESFKNKTNFWVFSDLGEQVKPFFCFTKEKTQKIAYIYHVTIHFGLQIVFLKI